MTFLLDVNVLIALIDPAHVAHDAAHSWFGTVGASSWATCPMTENGVVRVVGNPKYPNSPGPPGAVAEIMSALRGHSGHQFWPDDFSLVASEFVDARRVVTTGQVTDTYLLALAVSKRGKLATLDRRLSTSAVRGGATALELIPAG